MVRTLLSLIAIFLVSTAFGQLSIEIDPPEIHGTGTVDEADIAVYVTVTNTSDESVQLLWTRNEVEKPDAWWTWICDLNACYTWSTGQAPQNRTNDLRSGESMEFQIHARAFGEAGYAQIDVDLYDDDDPETILGTVKATIEAGTTSSDDLLDINSVRVYPNPTSDYFRIFQANGVENVEVYNIVGKRVLSYQAMPDGRYDVANLPEGMYLVRLLDRDNSVLKTVRLSKS